MRRINPCSWNACSPKFKLLQTDLGDIRVDICSHRGQAAFFRPRLVEFWIIPIVPLRKHTNPPSRAQCVWDVFLATWYRIARVPSSVCSDHCRMIFFFLEFSLIYVFACISWLTGLFCQSCLALMTRGLSSTNAHWICWTAFARIPVTLDYSKLSGQTFFCLHILAYPHLTIWTSGFAPHYFCFLFWVCCGM
jgi:hypothetical protein